MEAMKRKIEICEKCDNFHSIDTYVNGKLYHTSMWCNKCDFFIERYCYSEFENKDVKKDCDMFTEYCMAEWNGGWK